MSAPAKSIFGLVDDSEFERMTGLAPEADDLDRVNCPQAGNEGHMFCGICVPCGKPRFVCGHPSYLRAIHDR
jgi:hypothetical protein